MALNLSVVKSPAGVTLASSQKSFSENGGSIGRGDGNDWVLGDPDRFLSSRHCCVSFEGGQYYLTDTSTNGTFINGAPEPIGKGGKIPVNDGDNIELGDYQFRVSLQPEVAIPNDPFASASSAPIEPLAPEPQASFGGGNDPFASAAAAASPFDDPFGSSHSGQGATLTGDLGLDPEPMTVDPLAALDRVNGPGGSEPAPMSSPAPQNFGDTPLGGANTDIFGSATPQNDVFGGASMGDSAGAMNQSVDWPEVKNDSVIPENWDDDLLGGASASAPLEHQSAPADRPAPARAPEHRTPEPIASKTRAPKQRQGLSGGHRSLPLTEPPKMPTQLPEDELLAERSPERVDAFSPKEQSEPAPRTPTPRPQPRRAAPSGTPSDRAANAVGNALLEGLGLSESELTADDVDRIGGMIGELMPVIIDGMMQVLRSRASIKNEFRMNVTTIQPIENNPLKFSANAQEAIDNMFLRNSDAYMAPKQAFKEGFDGIGEHQVAIIAGIRAAFKSMMDRFNPGQLERQFDKQNKGVVLPGMQKNKYWNSYNDYYTGFIDNMENSFQYLFGDEFVQAYEDQLRRLSFERKQKQK
ncbi:MAG: type VI secretion system-associated FHA domain protein TagH [Agarilytica sp.]